MLVLSRKLGEAILIEGGIEITVERIDSRSVRLGIKAPQELKIMRADAKPKNGKDSA